MLDMAILKDINSECGDALLNVAAMLGISQEEGARAFGAMVIKKC